MLDEFVYGDVTRISPEAPTPVLAVQRSVIQIGGAGNVARNIAALGAQCILVSLIGNDDAGLTLTNALGKFDGLIVPDLVIDKARQTTRKVRFVSEHHSAHLVRADWETTAPTSAQSETAIIGYAENGHAASRRCDAVGLRQGHADATRHPRHHRRGAAARQTGRGRSERPRLQRLPRRDLDHAELPGVWVPQCIARSRRRWKSPKPRRSWRAWSKARPVPVTRSEEGMTLHIEGHAPIHIPAYPVKIRDVSGAGDTVAAVMAVLLAMQAPFESAMRAANAAAAVVVGKRGTATVSLAELHHRILPAASLAPEDKIVFDWSVLDERLVEWRKHGLRIGFTNGCFDLLHRGHIKLLAEARSACDRLVVGLNSDASTRRLKGNGRPRSIPPKAAPK